MHRTVLIVLCTLLVIASSSLSNKEGHPSIFPYDDVEQPFALSCKKTALVLHYGRLADAKNLRSILGSSGFFCDTSVTTLDASTVKINPTLLEKSKVVVLLGDFSSVMMDVQMALLQYLTQGGGVVLTNGQLVAGPSCVVAGLVEAVDLIPVVCAQTTLVKNPSIAVNLPSHPLFAGYKPVDMSVDHVDSTALTLIKNADVIASWADGTPLIVASSALGTTTQAVVLNADPSALLAATNGAFASVISNAVLYASMQNNPGPGSSIRCAVRGFLRVGDTTMCTLKVQGAKGRAPAVLSQFTVSASNGVSIGDITTPNGGFSFVFPMTILPEALDIKQQNPVVTLSAKLSRTGASLKKSPRTWRVRSPPSADSQLACDTMSARAGDEVHCTITAVPQNGIPATLMRVIASDYTIVINPDSTSPLPLNSTSFNSLVPKGVTPFSVLGFKFRLPASEETTVVNAALTRTGDRLDGSDVSIDVMGAPDYSSTIACDAVMVPLGGSTTCTISGSSSFGLDVVAFPDDFQVDAEGCITVSHDSLMNVDDSNVQFTVQATGKCSDDAPISNVTVTVRMTGDVLPSVSMELIGSPQHVSVSEVTGTTAIISWDAPINAQLVQSYIVALTQEGSSAAVSVNVDGGADALTTAQVQMLQSGVQYTVVVTAVYDNKHAMPSAPVTLVTGANAPTDVVVSKVTRSTAGVTWRVDNALAQSSLWSFAVVYGPSINGDLSDVDPSLTSTQVTYVQSGVMNALLTDLEPTSMYTAAVLVIPADATQLPARSQWKSVASQPVQISTPPTLLTTMQCAAHVVRANASATCTLTPRDGVGNVARALPSDFIASSLHGRISPITPSDSSDVTQDGATSLTFTYVLTDDGVSTDDVLGGFSTSAGAIADEIVCALATTCPDGATSATADGCIAVSGSPFDISIATGPSASLTVQSVSDTSAVLALGVPSSALAPACLEATGGGDAASAAPVSLDCMQVILQLTWHDVMSASTQVSRTPVDLAKALAMSMAAGSTSSTSAKTKKHALQSTQNVQDGDDAASGGLRVLPFTLSSLLPSNAYSASIVVVHGTNNAGAVAANMTSVESVSDPVPLVTLPTQASAIAVTVKVDDDGDGGLSAHMSWNVGANLLGNIPITAQTLRFWPVSNPADISSISVPLATVADTPTMRIAQRDAVAAQLRAERGVDAREEEERKLRAMPLSALTEEEMERSSRTHHLSRKQGRRAGVATTMKIVTTNSGTTGSDDTTTTTAPAPTKVSKKHSAKKMLGDDNSSNTAPAAPVLLAGVQSTVIQGLLGVQEYGVSIELINRNAASSGISATSYFTTDIPTAASVLYCDSVTLREGETSDCTIQVRGASALATANPGQFNLTLSSPTCGAVSTPYVANTNTLRFTYTAPSDADVAPGTLPQDNVCSGLSGIELHAELATSGAEIAGSPFRFALLSLPTPASSLACAASLTTKGTYTCTITVAGPTIDTFGDDSDFLTSCMGGCTAGPLSTTDGGFTFTFDVKTSGSGNPQVLVTLARTQQNIAGSPTQLTTYAVPTTMSTITCDRTRLVQGESTQCTIVALDDDVQPVATSATTFFVASSTGHITQRITLDGGFTWVFNYTAPAFGAPTDTLYVELQGDSMQAISGAPVTMNIFGVPDAMQSTVQCTKARLRQRTRTVCTIMPRDHYGNSIQALPEQFDISAPLGGSINCTMPNTLECIIPRPSPTDNSLAFAMVMPDASVRFPTLRVALTAAGNGALVGGAPMTFVNMGTPASASVSCAGPSTILARTIYKCNVTAFDANGNVITARPTDFTMQGTFTATTSAGVALQGARTVGKMTRFTYAKDGSYNMQIAYIAPSRVRTPFTVSFTVSLNANKQVVPATNGVVTVNVVKAL